MVSAVPLSGTGVARPGGRRYSQLLGAQGDVMLADCPRMDLLEHCHDALRSRDGDSGAAGRESTSLIRGDCFDAAKIVRLTRGRARFTLMRRIPYATGIDIERGATRGGNAYGFEELDTYAAPRGEGKRRMFRGGLGQPGCRMSANRA